MKNLHFGFILRLALACGALLTLTACASFAPDGRFGPVEKSARERLGKDLTWARTTEQRDAIARRVRELLVNPLDIEDAVQIALLNNRGLQASFAQLGIAEADLVRAGRLPNPHFSIFRARRDDESKIEQALTFNPLSLITMPMASALEERRFEATRSAVTFEMLRLAAETRKAWIIAVSAEENRRYLDQVKTVADASAELARRMQQVGNWSKLAQAREQGFYADAALNHARAVRRQVSTREALTRLMGLWGEDISFKLPGRLPDLPARVEDLKALEQRALEERLDVKALRLGTDAMAKNLGLSKATRFINVIEFGPARVREGQRSEPFKNGYELSLEIPLFDFGTSKVARAEALYLQSVERLAEAAVNARSEVREAYHGYRVSHDIARHWRDEIVPLRKRIADENLLRYNGMLIGVFELLADARSQISSVNGYIDALRDFWLARADLDMALIGKPNMSVAGSAAPAGGDSPAPH